MQTALLWATGVSVFLHSILFFSFLAAVWRDRFTRRSAEGTTPVVSILKPLAGDDDELALNLASFADLDYPDYEILFGVASLADRAAPVAQRFIDAHPSIRAKLVVTERHGALNPKVAQLMTLVQHARGEVVVISDSNVRVGRRYLWPLVERLADRSVGMVTGLFAGVGEATLGGALENLQIGALVGPSLAAAALYSKRPPTIGKSMAMRRADVARLGLFSRVRNTLAEDQVMGRIVLDAGMRVCTSFEPVMNVNASCTVMRTIERHTRWAKIRRVLTPTLFVIEPLHTPAPFAALAMACGPDRTTALLLTLTVLLQLVTAWVSTRVLRGTWMSARYLPLELVRTVAILGCWTSAWFSRSVCWRGHHLVIGAETEVRYASDDASSAGRGVLAE